MHQCLLKKFHHVQNAVRFERMQLLDAVVKTARRVTVNTPARNVQTGGPILMRLMITTKLAGTLSLMNFPGGRIVMQKVLLPLRVASSIIVTS